MSEATFAVRAVHPYTANNELLADTVRWQYGDRLSPEERRVAEDRVREHFGALYLLEVAGADLAGRFDWAQVTQEIPDLPRANWQVPYDERPLDEHRTRWAFFFHYLKPSEPLLTPYGRIPLPAPTPLPAHSRDVIY